MAKLSKEQLLKARNAAVATVTIDELGGDIGIRMLSLDESAKFAEESEDMDGMDSMRLYASYLIADENGERMLTADEIGALPTKSIMRIVDEGNRMNGVDDDAIEEAAKN